MANGSAPPKKNSTGVGATVFVTAAALRVAMPRVCAAPRDYAATAMLCRCLGRNQRLFPEHIAPSRQNGVAGDYAMASAWLRLANGQPDPRIQVSILPQRVLDLTWTDREATPHRGDTIIADLDLSLNNLPAGTFLQVGTAVRAVSDLWNEGCVNWRVRNRRDAYDRVSHPDHESLRLRGIYCRIERGGVIRAGDRISKLRAGLW